MKNKIYQTFDEAVAGIPDGSTIMFPGFVREGRDQGVALRGSLLVQDES